MSTKVLSLFMLFMLSCFPFMGQEVSENSSQPDTSAVESATPAGEPTTPHHPSGESTTDPVSLEKMKGFINRFWMLLAALLVFFMQAGFKVFEVGLVRKIDGDSVGFKNLADWMIVTLLFWLVGYAFMFGDSKEGAIGTTYFGLSGFGKTEKGYGVEHFLFQVGFAATAVTIVSGALAVRIKLLSYMILAALITVFIYPIFGHWVWGGGWLSTIGFHDFAGSTVVHSVGAWVALTGMYFIRPRMGKRKGRRNQVEIHVPNEEFTKFKPHNLGYSVLGVLILWVGWWGFNGGSTDLLAEDGSLATSVPKIILNTNLAGVAAGLTAFFHCFFLQNKDGLFEKTLGGALGGLVAITACCDLVSLNTSLFIGLLAGVLHNISYDRLTHKALFNRIIDDPVGAIPVHGVCGILGTLCVAFGDLNILAESQGLEAGDISFLEQLGKQLLGVVVCGVFTVGASVLFFGLLRRTVGLEIEPDQESLGKTF